MVSKKNHSSLSIQGIYFLLIGMCAGESDDRSTSADAFEGRMCDTRGMCVLKLSWCFVCVGGVWEVSREGREGVSRGIKTLRVGGGVLFRRMTSPRRRSHAAGAGMGVCDPRSDSDVLRLRWRRCATL